MTGRCLVLVALGMCLAPFAFFLLLAAIQGIRKRHEKQQMEGR